MYYIQDYKIEEDNVSQFLEIILFFLQMKFRAKLLFIKNKNHSLIQIWQDHQELHEVASGLGSGLLVASWLTM